MDSSLIYAKTPKGLVEIRNRSGRLSPLMRRVLIMINGRSEFDELAPAVPPGQLAGIIDALESAGLIEVSEVLPTALPEPEPDGVEFDLEVPAFDASPPRMLEPRFNLPPQLRPAPIRPVVAPVPPSPPVGQPVTAQAAAAKPGPSTISRPGPQTLSPRTVGGQAPAAPASAPSSAAAPVSQVTSAGPTASLPPAQGGLDEQKSRAVRELFNLLGPYGESAAASIRESTTISELLDSLRDAASRVAVFRGQSVARDFLRMHGIDVDAMIARNG